MRPQPGAERHREEDVVPPPGVATWVLASKLAMDLVARERVVPTISRRGGRIEARWAAALAASEDAAKVAALAKSMPPAAHAVPVAGDRSGAVWAPDALLGAYLDAIVDALVRTARGGPALNSSRATGRASTPASRARTARAAPDAWADRWRTALGGAQRSFETDGFAERSVVDELARWSEPALGARDRLRACFRLELPVGDGEPFVLRFLLQSPDDPSLLVPASDVWKTKGRSLEKLGRAFRDPQESLLDALGRASRLFPGLSPFTLAGRFSLCVDLRWVRCAVYTRQSVKRPGDDPAVTSCSMQRMLCTEFNLDADAGTQLNASRVLEVTGQTLNEIGAGGLPHLVVLSKIDRVSEEERRALRDEVPEASQLSAFSPADVAAIRQRLIDHFDIGLETATFEVPCDRLSLFSELREQVRVVAESYDAKLVVTVRAAPALVERLRKRLGQVPTPKPPVHASPRRDRDDERPLATGPAQTAASVQLVALAARHGLAVDADDVRINEAGLDFRVAFVRAAAGQDWVLRVPRRPDVAAHLFKEREGDPAFDFTYQHMMGPAAFEATVAAYLDAGGVPLPHLAERCAALAAAAPLAYGLFALQSGNPEHRAAAVAQLLPEE